MAYHKSWTNEDLRAEAIACGFPEYDDKIHFGSVVYNGVWTTISFIQRKAGVADHPERPEFAVVFSHRELANVGLSYFYHHTTDMVKALTKEEGNRFYKAIKATKRTSKSGTIYYDLGKALDMIPSDSTLKNKFVGA